MEKTVKKNAYMFNWITLLYSGNWQNTVNQLSFNKIFRKVWERSGRHYSSPTGEAALYRPGRVVRPESEWDRIIEVYVLDAKSLYFVSLSLSLSLSWRGRVVARDDFIFYFVSGTELRDLCEGGYIIVFYSFSQQLFHD